MQQQLSALEQISEVMAQADYVISILEQVELFVQIKLTEKDVTGVNNVMLFSNVTETHD